MKRWVISDTHFYHKNIERYCGRPAQHTEMIISGLKNRVKREDVLYHLGDVHFGTEQQLRDILSGIPCRKYLIRGNHDRWTDSKYLICGFAGVFDSIVIGNGYLTHIPQQVPVGKINVHGHLHNIGYAGVKDFGESYEVYHDKRHVLYSPEIEGYVPVRLEQLIARGKLDG